MPSARGLRSWTDVMSTCSSAGLWRSGVAGWRAARAGLHVSPAVLVRAARRRVPASEEEQSALQRRPEPRPEARRLTVAVLGVPNSGKSTLVNRLLSWPVCPVSSKVHTTVASHRAALTVGDVQLVLEDTPGLVTEAERRRHGLEGALLREPLAAVRRADLVCVLHDVSDPRNRAGLSPKVQRLLFAESRRPAVLVMTKVDTLRQKRRLLELTHELTDGWVGGQRLSARPPERRRRWLDPDQLLSSDPAASAPAATADPAAPAPAPAQAPADRRAELEAAGVELADGFLDTVGPPPPPDAEHQRLVLAGRADRLSEAELTTLARRWRAWPRFQRVFATAALEGAGVAALSEFLLSAAKPGGWLYSGDMVTDRRPRKLAEDAVRAALLEHLPAEVPYGVTCQVTQWERGDSEVLAAEMRVQCRKLQHSRILLKRIRAVARDAEQRLRDAFRTEVTLRLDVHPRPPAWGRRGA